MNAYLSNPADIREWRATQVKFRSSIVIFLATEPSDRTRYILTDAPALDAPHSEGYENGQITNQVRTDMYAQCVKASIGFQYRPVWVYGGSFARADHSYIHEWTDTANGKTVYVSAAQGRIFEASNPQYQDNFGYCHSSTPYDAPLHEADYELEVHSQDAVTALHYELYVLRHYDAAQMRAELALDAMAEVRKALPRTESVFGKNFANRHALKAKAKTLEAVG